MSDDDLVFLTDDAGDDIDSAGEGHSTHLWLTLDHDFSDDLRSTTLLSAARVEQNRDSAGTDERALRHRAQQQRVQLPRFSTGLGLVSRRLRTMPRWGFNLGDQHGDYDYSLNASIFDPLVTPAPIDTAYATDMGVDMRKAGRIRGVAHAPDHELTAEAGVRWDQYRYDDGRNYDVVSPRLNVVYSSTRQRTARRLGRDASAAGRE